MVPSIERTGSHSFLELMTFPRKEEKEVGSPEIFDVGLSYKKFELEQRLNPVFNSVENPRKWPLKKVIRIAFDAFCEDRDKKPLATLAKGIISLVGMSAIYPAAVGAWACIKTLQVIPVRDLESTDSETAMIAAQGIGNAGMAVTYVVQLQEFVVHPLTNLFIKSYNIKVCEHIRDSYSKVLLDKRPSMNSEEVNFFIKKENEALFHYNGLPVSDQCNIDEIQIEIAEELEKSLSMRVIVNLTILQIKEDVKESSWSTILTKIAKTALVVGVVAGSYSILGIGTYGCYKPFGLQSPSEIGSSNPEKVQDATANYANAGHGLEYMGVMGMFGLSAARSIIGDQYRRVVSKQIQDVYNPYIKKESQPKEVSNLLYKRMNQELSQYRS